MNDFDFDVVQKKRLVASARKQKNGCKSKKCSLPSDNLTAAQIKAKNGPVEIFNLDAPVSWESFKAMPADLQAEYIRRLNSCFGVGLNTISMDLFNLSSAGLRQYLTKRGNRGGVRGQRLSSGAREVWERWIHGTEEQPVEEAEPVCVVEEEEESAPVDIEPADFGVTNLAVEWCGEFDARAFVERVTRLEFPKGKVRISLEVEQV